MNKIIHIIRTLYYIEQNINHWIESLFVFSSSTVNGLEKVSQRFTLCVPLLSADSTLYPKTYIWWKSPTDRMVLVFLFLFAVSLPSHTCVERNLIVDVQNESGYWMDIGTIGTATKTAIVMEKLVCANGQLYPFH